MKIHWLNKSLGFYVAQINNQWALFNQFGYAGLYPTLAAALKADEQMTREH